MDSHFRAFSFVDRIDTIHEGVVRGAYVVPNAISNFPLALVGEAVGQLAAWHAMKETGFAFRPLAGLASKVDLLGVALPGDELELQAEVSNLTAQAMSYGGRALVNGTPVLVMEGCVGPMLPAEQFDDPDALKARFAALLEGSVEPCAFAGAPELEMELSVGEGNAIDACIQVPEATAYFEDHFPRMPVLPGTLQIDAQRRLVSELMDRLPGSWAPTSISNSKLRAFVPPGARLQLEAALAGDGEEPVLTVTTKLEGRTVGSARWHAGKVSP